MDLEVALRAKGIGSTLYCKDNLNLIDFGTEYTFNNITKEFFLENRGRKQMKIQWVRNMKVERKTPANGTAAPGKKGETGKPGSSANDKASNAEASSTQGGAAEKEEEVKIVYSIIPDQIVLNPKMGIMI
jgi:hydrocephalus-inducing protein